MAKEKRFRKAKPTIKTFTLPCEKEESLDYVLSKMPPKQRHYAINGNPALTFSKTADGYMACIKYTSYPKHHVKLSFSELDESDVVAKLSSVKDIHAYVCGLIRADIQGSTSD